LIRSAAPAKINLGLDILYKRDDGFHELKTVFLAVGLEDVLEGRISRGNQDSLRVRGPYAAGIPETLDNLVLRGIASLRGTCNSGSPPIEITLTKNIPHGAGLGGGSSDAAAAIRIAATMWRTDPGGVAAHEAAAAVGSDCAFFINGGAAIGTGRGEMLQTIPVRRELHAVIVSPPFGVSTRDAYAGLKPENDFGERSNIGEVAAWLAGEQDSAPHISNSFTRIVALRYPEITEVIDALRRQGAVLAEMSGSGSCCFGLFEDPGSAMRAAESLGRRDKTCAWAREVTRTS
jgi:4-diphosphocytidyl-2-C-methyl-D-erythritol kinase